MSGAGCGAVVVNAAANGGETSPAPALPGLRGAAARVVPWALGRATDVLARGARRQLALRAPAANDVAPSADERVVLNILAALKAGDRATAARASDWLVRGTHRDALLRALQPVADAV